MLNAMTDEEYMQLALQEARAADVIGEIPIGAVLVVEGEVVAKAHNMRETWNDATAHAEDHRDPGERVKSWAAGV